MNTYFRRFQAITAVRLPEKGGDRSHVDAWLLAQYGPDHPIVWEDDGRIEVYIDEYAKPGDWLVANGEGELPMVYEDDLFSASFVTAAEYEPQFKAEDMPAGLPIPQVVMAALAVLAGCDEWGRKDHQMLIGHLVHLTDNQIPPGYTALLTKDLEKLDIMAYEQLRAIFPTLPQRTSLITLDSSIGAARNGHH